MDLFKEFINTYGVTILYTVLTAVMGYIGIFLRGVITKYINDKTKKDVVRTCVNAIEQIYKDMHGEEKLNKCIESVITMLSEKGITVTDFEVRMLIEASVKEMNKQLVDVLN